MEYGRIVKDYENIEEIIFNFYDYACHFFDGSVW